ncbi:hemagglutinin repeat-containing protein, partial [Sterolibacterium denitrificans]
MQALAAASAGLAGYQGYQAVVAGQAVQDGNLADQAGGVSLSVSLGSSKSQSTSTQTSDTAAGSTVAAGGDVTILAMGNGEKSDITVQGSSVSAGRNVSLLAEDEIKLLAAANTGHSQSNSTSSSASIGVSLNLGVQTGLSVGVAASKGTGQADGDDLVWTNTNVSAGETARLASGGDTTLRGAVIEAPQVIADVGGNLAIESLQDTSTYNSQQHSSGFSISVPILGAGGFGGSIGGGKSNVDSTYASVNEQSGIRAGDEGFQVDVQGDTTLTGGAITSTQPAIDEGKNHFETGGELSLADITNHAEYEGKGASINLGAGISLDGKLTPQGTSAGVGEDENSAGSMTLAAISGIAGNKDARTGDAETGIAPIFDAEKVQKEIDAQVQITQVFGQQASKAVGDYAEQQLRQANILRAEGKEDEANTIEAQWGKNGTLRLAAHTLIGSLTGGASGAAGAAAGTLTAPAVADALANANIDGLLATTLTGLASTAAGALAGGSAGAATAFNEVTNNYLSHLEEAALKRAKAECARTSNSPACAEQTRLENLDRQRDEEIQPLIDTCRQQAKGVDCDAMARHYAETNGFGYASAKYESSGRSGSPFSFNGKLEGEGEDAHYVAPQIKMKDGTTKTDPGGLSYGMFQLSSERGGLEDFLNYLKLNTSPEAQNFYQELTAVGGLSAARAGTPAFVDKFMELTQHDPQFIEYQFESINQGSNMTRIRKQLDTV